MSNDNVRVRDVERNTGPESSGESNADAITVHVWSRQRFESGDFDPVRDKFKDAIVLPPGVSERLFPEGASTGYVRASAPEDGRSITLYALTFDDAYDSRTESGAKPGTTIDAYLRKNVRRRSEGLPIEEGSQLELEAVEAPDSGPLSVVRFSTRTESTRDSECRVNPDVLERVALDDGDEVELYNPDTGGRMRSTVRSESYVGVDEISLSTRSRKLLRVEIASRAAAEDSRTLHLRRPVETAGSWTDDASFVESLRGGAERVVDRLFDAAVGSNEICLRVMLGLNADEGRETARTNPETMRVLCIDDGDRIDVIGDVKSQTVRCYGLVPDSHLVETDEDFEPEDVLGRTLLLPATEREAAGALCDDIVRVRRNTRHVAVRSIVPSMFGFLGVMVGGLQAINLMLEPDLYGPAIAVVVLTSLAAVWFVLWPERQRCR